MWIFASSISLGTVRRCEEGGKLMSQNSVCRAGIDRQSSATGSSLSRCDTAVMQRLVTTVMHPVRQASIHKSQTSYGSDQLRTQHSRQHSETSTRIFATHQAHQTSRTYGGAPVLRITLDRHRHVRLFSMTAWISSIRSPMQCQSALELMCCQCSVRCNMQQITRR